MSEPSDSWTIRATSAKVPTDVADLAALQFEWRGTPQSETGLDQREFAAQFATWYSQHEESHVGFVGSIGQRAAAMAWLAIVDRVPGPQVFVRRCAYVQSVFVSEEFRNAGVGTRLVSTAISHARDLGLDYLAVHPSQLSFPFYERLGFIATPRVLELDFRPERRAP